MRRIGGDLVTNDTRTESPRTLSWGVVPSGQLTVGGEPIKLIAHDMHELAGSYLANGAILLLRVGESPRQVLVPTRELERAHVSQMSHGLGTARRRRRTCNQRTGTFRDETPAATTTTTKSTIRGTSPGTEDPG